MIQALFFENFPWVSDVNKDYRRRARAADRIPYGTSVGGDAHTPPLQTTGDSRVMELGFGPGYTITEVFENSEPVGLV